MDSDFSISLFFKIGSENMKKMNFRSVLALSLTPLLGLACGQTPQTNLMPNSGYLALAGTWRVTGATCSNGSSYLGMFNNGGASFNFNSNNASLVLSDGYGRREVYNFTVSPSTTINPGVQVNPNGTTPYGTTPYGTTPYGTATPYAGYGYPSSFGIILQSIGSPLCSNTGGAATTCSLSPAPAIWSMGVNLTSITPTVPGTNYMPVGGSAVLTGTNDPLCGSSANSQITIMKTN